MNTAPNGLNSGAYQCITVVPGRTYDFGGRIYIPSGNPTGQANLGFYFLNQANCSGTFIGPMTFLQADFNSFDTWQAMHADNVVAPNGAVSMQVYAQLVKSSTDARNYKAYVDMLYATQSPGKF